MVHEKKHNSAFCTHFFKLGKWLPDLKIAERF